MTIKRKEHQGKSYYCKEIFVIYLTFEAVLDEIKSNNFEGLIEGRKRTVAPMFVSFLSWQKQLIGPR